MLVGFTIGMMRTVVPALSESEFGVPKNSFMLLTAFVVAFGLVKGALNFVTGRLSEHIGRKRMLLLGWAVALTAHSLAGLLCAVVELDRRGHSAARHQPGADLVDDADLQAGHHPRRPTRADHRPQ